MIRTPSLSLFLALYMRAGDRAARASVRSVSHALALRGLFLLALRDVHLSRAHVGRRRRVLFVDRRSPLELRAAADFQQHAGHCGRSVGLFAALGAVHFGSSVCGVLLLFELGARSSLRWVPRPQAGSCSLSIPNFAFFLVIDFRTRPL